MEIAVDNFLLRSLKHEKKMRLGIIEKFMLGRLGKKDGLHGLPKEDEDGQWTSPTIQREINACNESNYRIYGILQIKLGKKYKTAAKLADRIECHEAKINELKGQIPRALTEEESRERRHGEEKLSISQVQHRRREEYERLREKYQVQINQIREELEADYEELIELKNDLVQRNHEAEVVCRRIRNHTQQRIDYYWNKAGCISYKNKRNIPAAYRCLPMLEVAESYKMLYRKEEQKIEAVIGRYNIYKEEA